MRDGVLEIDDQLNVLRGGKLEMEGGELFAHKFGEGSPIGDTWSDKSPLYIEMGASGSVSGGSIMITGKPSATALSAIQIDEPTFTFTGNSVLEVRSGVSTNLYSCGISTASGVSLNKLRVKDGKKLIINSDVVISSDLEVQAGSELEILGGNNLSVGN